jgi:hypothetical protein
VWSFSKVYDAADPLHICTREVVTEYLIALQGTQSQLLMIINATLYDKEKADGPPRCNSGYQKDLNTPTMRYSKPIN